MKRKPGCFLVLRGNQWLYWIENNGKRVYRLVSPVDAIAQVDQHHRSELKAMFGLILRRQGLTKIVIERWNGIEAAESEAGELLRSMGAERDRKSFVLWMSKLG